MNNSSSLYYATKGGTPLITATFTNGLDEVTAIGLTQWDYGQKLQIIGLTLPATFQVHFACKRANEAVVRLGTNSGGVGTVAIPDGLLEQDTPIAAWIYIVGEGSGETIKAVRLPILPRKKPQEFISTVTPSEQTMLENFLSDVNEAMTNTINTLTAHVANKNNPHEVTPTQIGASPDDHSHELSNPDEIRGTLPIERGGTNGTTAPQALVNLGIIYSETEPEKVEGRIWLKPVTSEV